MKVLLMSLCLLAATLVQAQHKFIEMNPPKAKPYLKSQLERMDAINQFRNEGVIGETDSAMLAIHDTSKLKAAQIKKVKEVMDAENKDRKAILDEIAKFNKLTDKEKEILIRSAYETHKNRSIKNSYYFEKDAWHKKY